MKKLGSGSRATFVSPYLRRPLRSLNKVLDEQGEEGEVGVPPEAANDAQNDPAWEQGRKPAIVSD